MTKKKPGFGRSGKEALRAASGLSPGQGPERGGDGAAGGAARPRATPTSPSCAAAPGSSAGALDRLARADAFSSLALDRRGALWRAIGLDRTGHEQDLPPLFAWAEGRGGAAPSRRSRCRAMTLGHQVAEDYANLRLSLRAHPLACCAAFLPRRIVPAERLAALGNGRRVEVAGLVLVRQRPGTASGVIFITLEDETGIANLVVWPKCSSAFAGSCWARS